MNTALRHEPGRLERVRAHVPAMLDARAPVPAGLDAGERLALAWALKEAGHAAWNTEPQRTVRAADALRALRAVCESDGECDGECVGVGDHGKGSEPDTPHRDELVALSDWTDAIADIIGGRLTEAAAALDRAAQRFRRVGQAHHAAQTQVPKIMVLGIMGRHAEAAACAEHTLGELTRLGDPRAAAKVCLNLGSLALRRDAYADAANHYREAAVLFARAGDREHSVMADIGLADALSATGDLDEAARIYARARMRAASHGLPVLEAMIDESMALLDLSCGRYRDALGGLERSRRRYEQLNMPQQLAIAEKQLGDAYLELRLLPEATTLLEEAVARFDSLGMPDDQAWAMAQLGRARALQGHTEQATASLGQAASLFAVQGSRVGEAAVALVRAELELASGDALAALALAESATAGFDAAGHAQHRASADAQAAAALLRAGQVDAAGKRFQAGLKSARDARLLPTQVRCLTGLGLVAQAKGKVRDAIRSFEAAIELFEDQRRALPGDELHSAFLTDQLRPYQALLQLALDAPSDPLAGGEPLRAAQVLWQLDRMRARALAERLSGGTDCALVEPEPAPLAGLRSRLNWLYRRVQARAGDNETSTHWQDEIRRTEQTLMERTRRQRLLAAGATPRSAGLDDGFSVPALQERLGPADALVEYGMVGEELFACVVTATDVHLLRRLALRDELRAAVQGVRFQIESLRHGTAPMAQHMALLERRSQLRLQQLHHVLWAPLEKVLTQTRRVLVVPHGPLGQVPFGALHDGQACVAERFDLAMAPSARVALHGLRRHPVRPQRALCLGESSRLPHAATEARHVASLFPHGEAFVGEHATVDAWRRHAGQADLLHLACHAQFRVDSPLFSALHLADGPLTAEAAERIPLRPGIVVLSACETGLSGDEAGDEMVGLVRAFMVAGAARVVGSLWPVEDRVASALMTDFCRSLCAGESPAAALRGAQLALRRSHPHPFHWAAFTLHGGW